MTPEQEKASNEAANRILEALREAKTPAECEAISEKSAKIFKRLQDVNPARAIHIINLAGMKKRDFEAMEREKKRMERKKNKDQMDLWA